jgi:hypothetical protein
VRARNHSDMPGSISSRIVTSSHDNLLGMTASDISSCGFGSPFGEALDWASAAV